MMILWTDLVYYESVRHPRLKQKTIQFLLQESAVKMDPMTRLVCSLLGRVPKKVLSTRRRKTTMMMNFPVVVIKMSLLPLAHRDHCASNRQDNSIHQSLK